MRMITKPRMEEGFQITPALILDLDGTVRRSKSGKQFIDGPADIELMPGIEKIIQMYSDMAWLVAGVSNQGGVAHGYKSTMQVHEEMRATVALFKENPFRVIKCCFHMEDGTRAPFNHRSLNRKPEIGMLASIEEACIGHGVVIEWDKSIIVGDRNEDEELAKNARVQYYDIDTFLNMPHEFKIEV